MDERPVSGASWGEDLREMARIAAPVVLVNMGMQAMGMVDALMVGRLGGAAIAAVALGNFYVFNASVFGMGLLFALDPVVSQGVGARDTDAVALGVQRGVLLSLAIVVVVTVALLPGEWLLGALRQPPDVAEETARYVRRRALAMVPFFGFLLMRQVLQAMGTVRPVLLAVLAANLVNVAANWALIEGRWGAPALGVEGAGYATAVATWAMAGVLAWLAWPRLRATVVPWRPTSRAWGPMRHLLRIGAPIAAQWFFESFAFGFTAVLMGWMGTASLAGHEIALNLAAMTYMVPLGISGAAAAVVGRAIGRGEQEVARRDAAAAIACGVGFMTLTAALFLTAPEWLATRYTTEGATVAVAAALIPIAGVFQVFDGLQGVTSGVLRGTGDTRVPALLHLLAFWAVGMPLGAWLGFATPLRERGLWIGLVAGLAMAGALQSVRVWHRFRAPIARVRLDG
jgi:MATE family multidrug resistance protein